MTATQTAYAAAMLATLRGCNDMMSQDAIACAAMAAMTDAETRVADLFVRACLAND
jgi:hypothetical protein